MMTTAFSRPSFLVRESAPPSPKLLDRVREASGARLDTTARLVADVAVISRAEAAIGAKYGGQKWLLGLGSRLSGRVRRRAWVTIVATQ